MKTRGGFALVVVVSLLALLVVLVVSLAALARVETAVTRHRTSAMEARRHALAGLHVALGRLQAAAGPDRRVTASAGSWRSAASPVHPENRRWTGVWDSAGTAGSPLAWLVSGEAPDPSRAPPAVGAGDRDGMRLVGSGSVDASVAEGGVVVARERLIAADAPGLGAPATLGRFAYWIGDEGQKGNVAVVDRVASIPVPAAPADRDPVRSVADRERVGQLLAHRSGNDALNYPSAPWGFGLGAEDDAPSASRWNAFGRAIDDAQLRFQELADASAATRYRGFLRREFHSLGVHSRGLLVNTAAGGLRENWSDAAAAPAEIAALDAANEVMAGRVSVRTGLARSGDAAVQVKPVVTEFALDVVPYRDAAADGTASGRLLVGIRLRVELWNPHPVALAHTPMGEADYEWVVEGTRTDPPRDCGLPVMVVETPRQPGRGTARLDLAGLLPPGRVIGLDCPGDLAAGATVVLEAMLATDAETGLRVLDATPADASDDQLAFRVDADPARELAWRWRKAARAAGEGDLVEARAFPSPACARTTESGWSVAGNAPFASDAPLRQGGLSFHARLDPARASWAAWVAPDAAGVPPPHDLFANLTTYPGNAWSEVASNPAECARAIARQFDPAELFAVGRLRCALDLTLQRQLSLGTAHFMSRPGAPALVAGRPWGGAFNSIFDEAFLLPVPGDWRAGDTLPNPRCEVLVSADPARSVSGADLRGVQAARHLVVRGMFNVNSIEPAAWAVVLGRGIPRWSGDGAGGRLLENPFFALPQAAGHASAERPARRELTDTVLLRLATDLADRTARHGRPFGSLAEWINRGLLDESIAAVGINLTPAGTVDLGRLPEPYSTEYLTTAVVLQTHAPVLAVRSDTFRIRVAGEAINPATGALDARAFLEAIVQRFPELVDPGASIDGDAIGYGRRFEIVAFRWLGEAEL